MMEGEGGGENEENTYESISPRFARSSVCYHNSLFYITKHLEMFPEITKFHFDPDPGPEYFYKI